jgi:hypothetical protein
MRSIHALIAALVSLFVSTLVFAQSPNLHVSADETTVSVRGATPNGEVLFVGFQRSAKGFESVFRRIERIVEANAEGRAAFTLRPGVVYDAFFVAVDLQSGAFGSAVPPGKPTRGEQLPAAALVKGNQGRVESIEANDEYAFVVVVRPGVGAAYAATSGDGAPSDSDGRANGQVRIRASSLRKFRGNDSLGDDLNNGDLVIVFPAHRMTFLAGVVKP